MLIRVYTDAEDAAPRKEASKRQMRVRDRDVEVDVVRVPHRRAETILELGSPVMIMSSEGVDEDGTYIEYYVEDDHLAAMDTRREIVDATPTGRKAQLRR